MAEAYVLAGELHRGGDDYKTAFARYEERMMPFLRRKQESAAKFASSFAPKTTFGITVRGDGNEAHETLRVIDWNDPVNNDFLLASRCFLPRVFARMLPLPHLEPERLTRQLVHRLEKLGHKVILEPAPAA
jgi:hypothetical protein